MPELSQPVEIHHIEFNERFVVISFTDPNRVSKGVVDQTTRIIDVSLFPGEIDELLDTLRQLVDDADVVRRNPPDRARAG